MLSMVDTTLRGDSTNGVMSRSRKNCIPAGRQTDGEKYRRSERERETVQCSFFFLECEEGGEFDECECVLSVCCVRHEKIILGMCKKARRGE